MEETRQVLAAKFQAIFPHLDERQRRLLMGAEARALGHGGIRAVARAAGVREATVSLGVDELEAGAEPLGRARRSGGGRKRAAELDPGLRPALLALVEPDERGDPMSQLRWTTKSTRKLAGVSESFALAERLGLDPRLLFDVATVSSGNCWALQTRPPVPGVLESSPAEHDFRPGFKGALMLKDLELALAAADAQALKLPVTRKARDLYRQMTRDGLGDMDFSAVFTLVNAATKNDSPS